MSGAGQSLRADFKTGLILVASWQGEALMKPERGSSNQAQPTPWLGVQQSAEYLRIGVKGVYRAIRAGQLRAARLGGRQEIRVRKEWLDEYVEGCTPCRRK